MTPPTPPEPDSPPPADDATPLALRLSAWPALAEREGQPLRELAPRDAALLAWLAAEGPTPRARLAAVLWPDSDPEAARNALRQRLFQLRRQLGREAVAGAVTLALQPGVTHDLDEADTLLGEAEPDIGEAFSAWLGAQRRQRRERQVRLLSAQADAAEQARDLDTALAGARRLLQLEPASELAHRRLMRLHYLRGDRAAALLAFDACERVLKDEVGARPDAQTLALLAMIESAAPAAPPAPVRQLPPGVLRPPRLVGRERLVPRLLAPLGMGQHVLLLAEAGLGKSRLLEEAAAALQADGRRVAGAGARPGDAGRPFALLARVLQALVPQPERLPPDTRAVLAWAVPAFGPTPSGSLQAGPFEAAVLQVLQGPGVLLLDDLHFADAASLELLLRAAVEPGSRRAVFAARPAEMPPLLQAWRDGAGVALQPAELRLATLDEAAIAELVDTLAAPGLAGAQLAPALARHTGGNPQFVLETLKALLLEEGGAQHFLSGSLPLPSSVSRLIHQRLRQLSPPALKLARLAAVAGPDLTPALAAQVLGLGLLDLADPWAELEAAGVLRGNAFAHDLVSEGTLDTMPQVLRATLHEAVADRLAAQHGEPARIAAHRIAAGQEREAVPHLLQAAAFASARVQLRDAAAFCEQAAAICARLGDAGAELDALEAAVDALADVDLGPRMEALLQRLLALPLPDAGRARALSAVAAVRRFRQEDDEAESLGREALALGEATGQRALSLRIRYGLVQVLAERRRIDELPALMAPVRAWVPAEGDALQRLQLACMEGWVAMATERLDEAAAAWRRAEALAGQLDRPREQAMALNHLQVALSLTGRYALGLEAGQAERAITERHRLGGTRNIYLDLNLAIAAVLLGRFRDAQAALARAEAAEVPDRATLGLRRALLQLELGQLARCQAELQPLLDGSVPAQPTVRLNIRLLQLRALHAQEPPLTPQQQQARDEALAEAERVAALTGRADHAARIAIVGGRWSDPGMRRGRLETAAVSAARLGLLGLEAAARAALAELHQQQGDAAAAVAQAERALALRDQGVVPDQMPGVLLDAAVASVLAGPQPARARLLVRLALAWVDRVAQDEVPEAFRHGFLHQHPAHRRLRALAARLGAA